MKCKPCFVCLTWFSPALTCLDRVGDYYFTSLSAHCANIATQVVQKELMMSAGSLKPKGATIRYPVVSIQYPVFEIQGGGGLEFLSRTNYFFQPGAATR